MKTPYKYAGKITREAIADYIRGLKLYLTKEPTTPHQKAGIESEITRFENYKSIASKIK